MSTKNRAIQWYDKLAYIHDLLSFQDWPYKEARQQTINALNVTQGDIVIDLFCGTGVNFEHILKQIGADGRIIGIDGSAGMLAKAKKRIGQIEGNQQIRLIEQDLLNLDPKLFVKILPQNQTPKVLITLALGIFPNYREVFTNIFSALPIGTHLAILEGYCQSEARGAWLIDFIGHSDCRRRVWEPVKDLTNQYKEIWLDSKFNYIDAQLVVASGTKAS